MQEINPNSPSQVNKEGIIYIVPKTMRIGVRTAELMCEKFNITPSKNAKGNSCLNVKFATEKDCFYIKVVKEPTDKTVVFSETPSNMNYASCKMMLQAFILDFFQCKEKVVLQINYTQKLTNGWLKCVLDNNKSK